MFSAGKAADALAASMAVPVLFKPVWANGRPLIDGAVGDVAGVDGLERSERVFYHHVSFRHPRHFSRPAKDREVSEVESCVGVATAVAHRFSGVRAS